MSPGWRASCHPAARVQTTTVGMMSSILGMSRVVNSTRAGMDSRPRIGPSTNPRNRSRVVQKVPPTTWKKSTPHFESVAMTTTKPTSTRPTTGKPPSGTIWKSAGDGGPEDSGP